MEADGSPNGSPQASPPGSPTIGPALDGAEVARRILAATEAAAQAAVSTASAVEIFKKHSEANSSKSTDWFKLLPKPGSFEPKDYDQEVSMWRDWWWTVNQHLSTLDPKYETEVKYIEKHPNVFQDPELMSEDEKRRSMFLYGLLASLLKGRLLTVLRGVIENNGYEALRQLVLQCQPTSRNRSLGILHALMSWQSFDMKVGLLSQVVRLEDAFREYDKISLQPLGVEMKFAILLRCISGQLRTHLNITLKDDATYDVLRESILQFDRANIKWSETMALGNRSQINLGDEAVPMDIDRVGKGKEKGKGKKGKGKGKDQKGSKGKGKGDGKSKGKDKQKGKSGKQGKGSGNGKGKGSLPSDMCKLCGGYGHWGRECPTRALRQVSASNDGASTVATQSMVSSAGTTQPSGSPPNNVRRIIQVDLNDLEEEEVAVLSSSIRVVHAQETYDLTYSDSDEDWCIYGREGAGEPAYFERYVENTKVVVQKLDKEDGSRLSPTSSEESCIRGVAVQKDVQVILDTGADMSVLPMKYKDVGVALSRKSVLRDAQGNRMPGGMMREATIELEDDSGTKVCVNETFALSNVSEPLLALGKLLRRGWKVGGEDGQVHLTFGEFDKVVESRKNSLVVSAEIRMVTSDECEKAEIRAVTMTFEGHMRDLLTLPGWHLSHDRRVPFLVVHNSKFFKDCYPQFERRSLPFRTTIVKRDATWEVVEFADRSVEEVEIPECNGAETTVVSFFHEEMEDINNAGIVHTGTDDPFMQPRLREQQREVELRQAPPGEMNWPGQSLEDGVYDQDDQEEAGLQMEVGDGDPLRRELPQGEEEPEEIEIEGEKYTAQSSLRKLREGLKVCGLPKGRSKAQAWKRLVDHYVNFSENLGVELARREFERRKLAEGGDGVRPQSIPRLPTKAERQIHELTHWPYEDWCEHCVAARGKADPHRRQAEDDLRQQSKAEYPVVSMDFCFTRGLTEPTEVDKEDIRLYGGDVRGGVALIVTDDWTRGVLALPTPGKGRAHAKYLAEQVVRYIGACGFSTCIVKADAEPSTKLLLDIISKARQRLGFKTIVELSGPDDSQGNGRVEREIQTVRGLARTLIRAVREGTQSEIDVYGPLAQWALRHAAWLLTHFRRQNGSPTAYEMISGRKYTGKLANFGERVLARIPAPNGVDRFQPAIWVGKSDRADFNLVFVADGLRWTRTIRRLPVAYDAEFLPNVRSWPWSISHGQIGVKQSALLAKVPSTPLPPHLAPAIRAEEAAERRGLPQQLALQDGGDQRQAGPLNEEAASDPASSGSGTTSSSSSTAPPQQIDDDMLVSELVEDLREANYYPEGLEEQPKREGGAMDEDMQSPLKVMRPTLLRKAPRREEGQSSSSGAASSGINRPVPSEEDAQVRMVVSGQILEDGDQDLEFPSQPPELSPHELFEIEAKSIETEINRLLEMGVLRSAVGADLSQVEKLSTRFVMDWRWRDGEWKRRARLVARDYAWINPNRTDTFAPAGGQSLLRLVPCIAQLNGWSLATLDVKDAYLMCPQKKNVKVTVEKAVADALGIPQEWILGRVLPGQREGAAEWFQNLKGTLKEAGLDQCPEAPTVWGNADKTLALLIHVDDLVITGTDEAMNSLIGKLEEKYKISVERGSHVDFLKRSIIRENDTTKIKVNEKYLDGLVSLFGGVKKKKSLGELDLDETPIEDEVEISRYRSGVGTLLYIAGDRPDIQFHTKELASKLSKPTKGSMATLMNVIGYLLTTKDVFLNMDGQDPARSFREKANGIASGPTYENNKRAWLIEVATDSNWSGDKKTRSSTSCGCVFIGGNWVYSYSRTQKNITLSSTESEYVALVSGASEGLLIKAVMEHLVGNFVELKLYADNTAAVSIASKEGVSKIKHLDGKLLWIQQRQGRDFQLRRVDTLSNPSDLGTKCLAGRRVRLLLYLMGFKNELDTLGMDEFYEEQAKKEKREQLQSIRMVIHNEVKTCNQDEGQSSTLMNRLAKRLMRMTLAALLADAGEALSPEENGICYDEDENSDPKATTVGMVYFLIFVIFVLLVTIAVLAFKVLFLRHRNNYHRNMVRQVRAILKEDIQRREAVRLGLAVHQDEEGGESECATEDIQEDGEEVHIRMVKTEDEDDYVEENVESENEMEADEEEEEEETESQLRRRYLNCGMSEASDPDLWADIHYPRSECEEPSPSWKSDEGIPIGPAPKAGGRSTTTPLQSYVDPETGEEMVNVMVDAEDNASGEDWDPDAETDYGSVGEMITENPYDFINLDSEQYEDYRFNLLACSTGIEHYILYKLGWLRGLPRSRAVVDQIDDFMKLHKSVQLGGPGMRKRAMLYLRRRRRYEEMLDMNRVDPTEDIYSTRYPFEWQAAHHGWTGGTDDEEIGLQPGEDEEKHEEDSYDYYDAEEDAVMHEEGEEEEDDDDPSGRPSGSADRRGGKGRGSPDGPADPKDPPVFDEART